VGSHVPHLSRTGSGAHPDFRFGAADIRDAYIAGHEARLHTIVAAKADR
jgi:hypothetical protein